MTQLTEGMKAPDFSLQNQRGEVIHLKDLVGKKVVLYFYPKAMTPGCTTQACGLRDVHAELAARNTLVFGVSPDPAARLQKFIDKQELNFDLLSDEDHAVTEAYGCWGLKKFMGREFMGVIRTSFIIDERGCLVKVVNKFKTKDHHDVILSLLDTLK